MLASVPAWAGQQMVILVNESTDVFALSIDGAPACEASPGSGCIRSAKEGKVKVEACSRKKCINVDFDVASDDVVQFTIEERVSTGYMHSIEKRQRRINLN